MSGRQNALEEAKMAEQAERYDDMAKVSGTIVRMQRSYAAL